jgi:hypothetical protein
VPHYKDTNWEPEEEVLLCQCGCGQEVVWKGLGRPPKYVNDAHRKRHERRMKKDPIS